MHEINEALWTEFHRVVNMTSRELTDWLRTRSAEETEEVLPDRAGPPTGRSVLHILRKRKTELTMADEHVMRTVVRRVHDARDDLRPVTGRVGWRHRLMSLGHDPLKPAS